MWRRASASTPRARGCRTAAPSAASANIGVNPTTGIVDPRLEVWLFDFDEDIYGERIETDLIDFLRPEEKFDSVEAMVDQIRFDEAKAKRILAAEAPLADAGSP